MSQKAARASAREIRRAFGPAAVEHLDLLEHAIQGVMAQADVFGERIGRVEGFVRDNTFLGRLRWLFTGK